MANYYLAEAKTAISEGGYACDKADRGGETIFGISRKTFPTWSGWGLVDELRVATNFPKSAENHAELKTEAKIFLKKNFWDVFNLDEMKAQGVADALFDTAINCGQSAAVSMFQRALNAVRFSTGEPEIEADGRWGGKTVKAVTAAIRKDKSGTLVTVFQALRISLYVKISEVDETQGRFVVGWIDRAAKMAGKGP